MSEKRAYPASLITNENKLWVTGGVNLFPYMFFSSTEYILQNGESVEGPELPLGLAGHTVNAINSTFSMFIGGVIESRNSINLTYYYDHYNQAWFDGPRLNIARSYHGAGIVTDLITSEKFVVVTGGKYYDDASGNQYFRSTEILIDGKWVLGNCMYHMFAVEILIVFCLFERI